MPIEEATFAMTLIRFKHSLSVVNLLLNPQTTYDFECRESALHVRLTNDPPPSPDDARLQITGVLELCRSVEITEKRISLLRELEQEILASIPVHEAQDAYPVDAPARSESVKFDDLPGPLQELARETKQQWVPLASQILQLLRWRYGKWDNFSLRLKMATRWENDQTNNWFCFPSNLPEPGPFGPLRSGMSFDDGAQKFLQQSIERGISEPIGHELLQSADAIRDPRAGIVLSVSAVEVAIKALISEKVPPSEWLAFNLPMPPVERIIQEYLPKLFSNLTDEAFKDIFPKEVMQALKKYVGIRNAIAHRGEEADSMDAWKCCDCMRDVLFRLDYLNGCNWAKHYWKSPAAYGTSDGTKVRQYESVTVRMVPKF